MGVGRAEAEASGDGAPSRCLARLAEPHGQSGHSLLTKARFALSLTSPFLVSTIGGTAKDIYLEKFGCDGYTLWLLYTILLCAGPVFSVVVGNVQDKEYLGRCFSAAQWGRRAPWLLTHVVLAAVCAGLVYLPPGSYGDFSVSIDVYHAWFFVTVGLVFWSANVCIMAFEAARQEIYPYKEERIIVEGLCKYACMLGGGLGGLPTMVLYANARLEYRIGSSAFILAVALISLAAVPVMRQARSRRRGGPGAADGPGAGAARGEQEDPQVSIWREVFLRGAWNGALRQMWALKFWNGAYGASIASMLYYYITYVLRIYGAERSAVILAAGMAAGGTETVMNVVYMWAFSRGDGRQDTTGKADRRLLSFVVAMRLLNAALTVLVMFVLPPSVLVFLVWAVLCRVGLSGFSFWRVSAQCWLVDEDTQVTPGAERREARILSSLAAVQSVAGAACGSLTFLGLSLCGLETQNCEAICNASGAEDIGQCIADCTRDMIDGQPDALRVYISAVIGLWAPLCELCLAFHTYRFPIKGARLRRLYARVSERRGDEAAQPAAWTPGGPRCSRREAAEHFASSKIVLQVEQHPKEGLTASSLVQLVHTTSIVGLFPGSKSHAVIFDMIEHSMASRSIASSVEASSRASTPGAVSLSSSRSTSRALASAARAAAAMQALGPDPHGPRASTEASTAGAAEAAPAGQRGPGGAGSSCADKVQA